MFTFKQLFNTFISILQDNNVRYCILRGYEFLPNRYSNDIDFGIHPNDKKEFFKSISVFKISQDIELIIRDSRFEVLKISIKKKKTLIDLDFWFGLNYVGLNYMDIKIMIDNFRTFNDLKVLSVENELSLSFLKEILHCSWLRIDKIDILTKKLEQSREECLVEYFSNSLRKQFVNAILERKFNLHKLSRKAKLWLLFYHLAPARVITLFINFFKFVLYRYAPSINPLVVNIKYVIENS